MEQEEGREMPDGVESQTGYCRFCGQAGMVHTLTGWSQEDVDEAVTCKCECDAANTSGTPLFSPMAFNTAPFVLFPSFGM